jgi:diguanylate cyclase (GGDEF)-like protein
VNEIATCSVCGGSGVVAPGSPGDEQTLADRDQTASDQDQTWSDHDQSASDRDQRSADEDQRASDEDLAAGGDKDTHDRAAAARARTKLDREHMAHLRDETAVKRVESSADRDLTADERDRMAEARDRLARRRDGQDAPGDVDEDDDILLRAERLRASAATDRAKAAEDRSRAAVDRKEAALEREQAYQAQDHARRTLVAAATDELTGAWTRKVGLATITREIERAGRTGGNLVLAFIDVDHLKEVNDTEGHPAGDTLLHLVAETMKASVRPYDVIVRYGGDEFLCAMPNLTLDTARDRMKDVTAALAEGKTGHSIAFGLATYEPGEGLDALIGRADADLLKTRSSDKSRGKSRTSGDTT